MIAPSVTLGRANVIPPAEAADGGRLGRALGDLK